MSSTPDALIRSREGLIAFRSPAFVSQPAPMVGQTRTPRFAISEMVLPSSLPHLRAKAVAAKRKGRRE